MKFSIRELVLVTVIVGLAVAWAVDRSRLARQNQRMLNVMDEESQIWLLNPPAAGSQEAMTAFLREIKKPKSSRLIVATETCFVLGEPAANYTGLLAKADEKRPQLTGTNYFFYGEGKAAREGGYCVWVAVAGNPPVIETAKVTGWTY